MTDAAASNNAGVSELDKQRLTYAWQWFAYHAEQRMKLFHYTLIGFTLISAAIAQAVTSKEHGFGALFCAFGIVLSFIFSRLDRRNRDLVRRGEKMLRALEHHALCLPVEGEAEAKASAIPGLLTGHGDQDEEHWYRVDQHIVNAWVGAHRFWMPMVSYVFALAFAGGGYYFAVQAGWLQSVDFGAWIASALRLG
jgi:hypothetical protein